MEGLATIIGSNPRIACNVGFAVKSTGMSPPPATLPTTPFSPKFTATDSMSQGVI